MNLSDRRFLRSQSLWSRVGIRGQGSGSGVRVKGSGSRVKGSGLRVRIRVRVKGRDQGPALFNVLKIGRSKSLKAADVGRNPHRPGSHSSSFSPVSTLIGPSS